MAPYPGAYTEFKDAQGNLQTLKIFSSEKEKANHSSPNGLLTTDGKTFLKAACADGFINLKEFQLQGKKRMSAEEFLRGYKFFENCKFL